MIPVCAGAQGREDDQDDGGKEEGVLARPFVGRVAEDELAEYGPDEGYGSDVLLSSG